MRLVRARPRVVIAITTSFVVALALPAEWRLTTRLLVAWDTAAALYLALVYHMMGRSSVADIRRRAGLEDAGRFGIPVLTVASALASLGAIIAELGTGAHGGTHEPRQLLLATTTILVSWSLTHTIFALHYAHEFYADDGTARGLDFPGDEEPDYWDFVYFAFVIGMTSQVSDVAISSKPIRRTATAHGIVSFVFNAALLALTVNIAASAI